MIIFGIDPGSRVTGFGLVEISDSQILHVSHGVIQMDTDQDFNQRLFELSESLDHLLTKYKPGIVVIEKIFLGKNDDYDFKQKWAMDKDKQEKVVEKYNDADSPLKFLIVTAKLLTGFDAPILQTMYLDKSLKDHTLLQAICRTNRLFPNKTFGRIVDYFGVFDDTAKALAFDEESVKLVITNWH